MNKSIKNTQKKLTKNKKIFISGFRFIGQVLEKYYPEYSYETIDSSSNVKGAFKNYFTFRKLDREGKLYNYSLITLSAWENIIYYKKKNPNQIIIAYPNGFIVGINYDETIKDIPMPKKILHMIGKILFDKKMKQKYREADLLVVSTPNMFSHAKDIRSDAIWLPNPIETDVFNPKGPKVKLEGSPSIFLPTRIHKYKNPLFGMELFKKIKKKHPKAKLHLINYGYGEDPLFNTFKKMINQKDVIYHNKMDRKELSKYYRSADMVLGQFNESLGNFSMVELEAMASGAALVTLDKFEIKKEYEKLDNLEKLAFKLISDTQFRKEFVNRNLKYVRDFHSEKAVAKIIQKHILKKTREINKKY